jgi:hypothetical protein
VGFDRWDLLYPLAPKPLLILPSAADFAGTYSSNYISSGWEEFEKLRRIYGVLGQAERLAWQDSPLPHGLAYNFRLAIYNWFERWLKGGTHSIQEEPPVSPEPEEMLFVTKTGSVVQEFRGETPISMTRTRPVSKAPAPLDRLLGVDLPEAKPQAATLGRTQFLDVTIEAIEIPSAPKVWLPGWLYRGKSGDSSKPVILVIDPAGRAQWQEGGLYERLASEGCAVCALDVRGVGHMTPEYGRGSARHAGSHNSEQHYAWSSLILGKPLLGQRVSDILAAAQALRSRADLAGRRITVAARGMLTPAAQFTAALDKGIDALYLAGGLVSYRSVLETEEYLGGNYHSAGSRSQSDLFGSFVPSLLKHTDLPELMASIAPRRVFLARPIDAAGRTADATLVRKLYARATNVEILPESGWDAASISAAFRT